MSEPLELSDPAGAGKVDWKGATEYMLQGSEGDPDAPADSEDGLREFKYRGKAVKVSPETHELLEQLRQEARGANGRLGSELARTRERLARLEGATAARTPEPREEPLTPPDPQLAIRDFAAWQRLNEQYHDAKMERTKRELEARFIGEARDRQEKEESSRRAQAWADRFYQEYDHLSDPEIKPIVTQVYIEHKDEIDAAAEADETGAHERLAELAEKRLLRLRKTGTDTQNPTSTRRPPRLETSAGPTPRGKTEETQRDFSAGSWVARQRLKMTGRTPRGEK